MRNENYDIDGNIKHYLLQVESGGTGESNPTDALETLGGVAETEINKLQGVVGLNEQGHISDQYFPSSGGGAASICLYGPDTVALGNSIIIEITNYDTFTTYIIETNKLEVTRDNQFLLITGTDIGTDAWFSINGSVYVVNVTVDNAALSGIQENLLNFQGENHLGSIVSNDTGTLVALSLPTKTVDSSVGAGEVRLYNYDHVTGYALLLTVRPTVNAVNITYSGKGTKSFTANNQTTTRSDDAGTVTIPSAGNVLVKATGDQISQAATPQQGNPTYPNGLPPYQAATANTPQQGVISYPSGLPPYVPAQAAANYKASISVVSEGLSVSATDIDQTYYPWESFDLGRVLSLQGNVIAMGSPRTNATTHNNNGDVMVSRLISTTWSHFRLNQARTTPYGFFGQSLKLWDGGDQLAVGAPGLNTVYNYKFNGTSYVLLNTVNPIELPTASGFGNSLDINKANDRLLVGAPGFGANGSLVLYTKTAGNWVNPLTIQLDLPSGHKLGKKVRIVGVSHIYVLIETPVGTNNYVQQLTLVGNTWTQTQAFKNPSAGIGTESFGEAFDVSETSDMVFIASKGNGTTKGYTQIWVQSQGVWIFYKTMTAADSRFGDGFSASIAINDNGKGGHFLTNNGSTGAIGYYK